MVRLDFIGIGRKDGKEEERRLESILSESQLNLGQYLYESLLNAAQKNHVFNIMPDGTKDKEIKGLRVDSIPKNEEDYSVVVSLEDPRSFSYAGPSGRSGYTLFQVDLNIPKGILRVIPGDYGSKTRYYPLSSFQSVKKSLSEYTEKFCFFPSVGLSSFPE